MLIIVLSVASSSNAEGEGEKSEVAVDMDDMQRAIREGVRSACSRGAVMGFPVIDAAVYVVRCCAGSVSCLHLNLQPTASYHGLLITCNVERH